MKNGINLRYIDYFHSDPHQLTQQQHESAHLYKFQIALDFKTSWSKLEKNKKEEAISKMTSQCKKSNLYLEGLNLAEWRVYNLHRSTMKTAGGKQTSKGIRNLFRQYLTKADVY